MAYADITGTQATALLNAAYRVQTALSPNWSRLNEAPAQLIPTYTEGTASEGNDIDSLLADLQTALTPAVGSGDDSGGDDA